MSNEYYDTVTVYLRDRDGRQVDRHHYDTAAFEYGEDGELVVYGPQTGALYPAGTWLYATGKGRPEAPEKSPEDVQATVDHAVDTFGKARNLINRITEGLQDVNRKTEDEPLGVQVDDGVDHSTGPHLRFAPQDTGEAHVGEQGPEVPGFGPGDPKPADGPSGPPPESLRNGEYFSGPRNGPARIGEPLDYVIGKDENGYHTFRTLIAQAKIDNDYVRGEDGVIVGFSEADKLWHPLGDTASRAKSDKMPD